MTPELKNLQDQITALQEQFNSLNNNATIPFDIGEAIKTRVLLEAGIPQTSSKGATSENQAVNEGGAGTYSVLKAPDGFVQVTLGGTLYYLPYYS